jgi:hypothetical protein
MQYHFSKCSQLPYLGQQVRGLEDKDERRIHEHVHSNESGYTNRTLTPPNTLHGQIKYATTTTDAELRVH